MKRAWHHGQYLWEKNCNDRLLQFFCGSFLSRVVLYFQHQPNITYTSTSNIFDHWSFWIKQTNLLFVSFGEFLIFGCILSVLNIYLDKVLTVKHLIIFYWTHFPYFYVCVLTGLRNGEVWPNYDVVGFQASVSDWSTPRLCRLLLCILPCPSCYYNPCHSYQTSSSSHLGVPRLWPRVSMCHTSSFAHYFCVFWRLGIFHFCVL